MDVLDTIPPLKLDRSRQSAPQVFDALRELIVSMTLEPGTVLPRNELAGHYGLSQTPIRDALLRLEEDGLVDIFPQHATVVSRIDTSAALQAHFLRRAVELEILHTLCTLPREQIDMVVLRMQSHLKDQRAALSPMDLRAFAASDLAFHREIYQAAGVGSLWALIRQRSGHVDRLRRLNLPAKGKPQAVLRDHEAITQALARADGPAAQAALRRHLAGTLSFVDEVARRHPQWTS